jgi:hypothetical protein
VVHDGAIKRGAAAITRVSRRQLDESELVVRQSPAGKNVRMEAEGTVGIRHQTMVR